MKILQKLALLACLFIVLPTEGQLLKKKDDGGEETEESSEKKGKLGGKLKGFNPLKAAGKLVGNLMTTSTDDLSLVSLTALYMDNLYPSDAGTVETEYFGFWEEGTSAAGIMFMKREGIGFYKIDGKVFMSGNEIEHVANGFYGGVVDAGMDAHTFSVSTTSGQDATLEIDRMGSIEILSVNGQPKGERIAINKDNDLTLELKSDDPNAEGFYVGIVGKVMGVVQFNEIGGFFAPTDKITIPKEAWNNTMTPGLKFLEGDNYLLVTQIKEEVQDISGIGAARIISSSMDYFPISFTGQPEKKVLGVAYEAGAAYKGEVEGIKTETTKPSAFTGVPFSQAKKIAVGSFVVRATKLTQSRTEVDSYSYTTGNVKTTVTTTTTETRSFPEVPEIFWDQLVEEFYQAFMAEFSRQLDAEIIPIEEVIKAPSYDAMFTVSDTVTEEIVVKPYKNCKVLLPTSLSEIVKSISTTFPSDKAEVRILNEVGADALLAVTLDCEMAWDDGALSPRMAFRMTGGTNGWKVGPTVYMQGLIQGPGVGIDESNQSATDIVDLLKKIMRTQDLVTQFGASVEGLKKQEQEQGYDKIWVLR